MRARRVTVALTVATAAALAVTACGSSGSSGGATTGSASATYKVGVLVDETGPGASGNLTAPKGMQAYVNYVNSIGGINGAKLAMVTADTTSSPAGALTAAQKLVQNDHVFAIMSESDFFFSAESFLAKAGIPVIGGGYDGPEWNDPKNTNLFSWAVIDYTKVYSTLGEFMKSQGVTSCGTLAYGDSPSGTASGKTFLASCKAAGLQAPFFDSIKFSTTDIGPIALAIKNSHVDGVYMPVSPSTGFAVAGVLQQLGVKMKAIVFAIGYGGDLLASPAATKAGQGYTFFSNQQPKELNTAATQLQTKWLATVGVNGDPTFGEQEGWLSGATFAAGMQAAGANASQADFTKKLRAVTGFTAGGLLALPVAFADYSPTKTCTYAVKLTGNEFVPLSQKSFCGTVVGTL